MRIWSSRTPSAFFIDAPGESSPSEKIDEVSFGQQCGRSRCQVAVPESDNRVAWFGLLGDALSSVDVINRGQGVNDPSVRIISRLDMAEYR